MATIDELKEQFHSGNKLTEELLHTLIDSVLVKADAEDDEKQEATWLYDRIAAGIGLALGLDSLNREGLKKAISRSIKDISAEYFSTFRTYLNNIMVPVVIAIVDWLGNQDQAFADSIIVSLGAGDLQDALARIRAIPDIDSVGEESEPE